MKVYQEEILQTHHGELAKYLDAKKLTFYLYGKRIIDSIDLEDILSEKTRKDQSEALLSILKRKGPEAFPELVNGLQENQPFLACLLLREEIERLENEIAGINRQFTEQEQKEKKLKKEKQELETQLQGAEKEKKQLKEQIREFENTLKCFEFQNKKNNDPDQLENGNTAHGNNTSTTASGESSFEENRTSPRLRRERPPAAKQYVTLSYERDFDEKGVIYYLGHLAGINKWVNPAVVSESGVHVTCSDSSGDAVGILEYYDPNRCSDSSWWCVDLGEKYTLRISHYTLRQIGSDDRSFPKKWELQGRLNNSDKWISLRKHRDVNWRKEPTTYIGKVRRLPCKTKTWPIDGEVKAFRYFKIGRIEGETYEPTYRFHLAGMELYGVLSIMKHK